MLADDRRIRRSEMKLSKTFLVIFVMLVIVTVGMRSRR